MAFRFFLGLILFWMPAGGAFAGFDDSRLWFEHLADADRIATQNDLLLLGHYDFLVDGRFGHGTFDALTAFQHSLGAATTGVLDPAEQHELDARARLVDAELGIEKVRDEPAHVEMMVPRTLMPVAEETDLGTSYASEDGEISLETMHRPIGSQSFADLYDQLTEKQSDRQVTYRKFSDDRFVVSGTYGGYTYYTLFVASGAEAVGYSLAWGAEYQQQGPIVSVYLASNFSPLGALTPAEEPHQVTAAGPGEARGAFRLPHDQPEIIALNDDITGTTPAEFDRALKARPGARVIVLNSPGGAVESALVMAQEIRRRGLATYVPPEMGCYSACAYMFFAGADRQAEGELGVHQIYTDAADIVLAQTTLGDVLDALSDFGVEQRVISHMLRTPPDDMYIFSPRELADFGINRGAPIRLAVTLDTQEVETAVGFAAGVGAYVQLSSQSRFDEASRSLGYAEDRWGKLFGDADPEIETAELGGQGTIYRVRLPLPSLARANAICDAIKSDGGGCYVTPAQR